MLEFNLRLTANIIFLVFGCGRISLQQVDILLDVNNFTNGECKMRISIILSYTCLRAIILVTYILRAKELINAN